MVGYIQIEGIMQNNPVENMYLQVISKLRTIVFSSKSDTPELLTAVLKLEEHLEKAIELNLPRYEIKVRNIIGSYHQIHSNNMDVALDHFRKALERAITIDDVELQTMLLSNLGNTSMKLFYIQESKSYFDRATIVGTSITPPSIYSLYAFTNLANLDLITGDWQRAKEQIMKFLKHVDEIDVTPEHKTNYGIIIQYRYTLELFIYLALGDYDEAKSSINMAVQLANQLQEQEAMSEIPYLTALHMLIAQHDNEPFAQWYQSTSFDGLPLNEKCKIISLLQATGYSEYATNFANRVLMTLKNEDNLQRVYDVFKQNNVEHLTQIN